MRVNNENYLGGGQRSVLRKKRNTLQPVLSNLFSPSKRKFSNPEVLGMESASKKCRVNNLIDFWENNQKAKLPGSSQGSRGGRGGDQVARGSVVDGGQGQADQCAGSR